MNKHLKIAQAKADEFMAQLREATAAFGQPFSSCEVGRATNFLEVRGHVIADLREARNLAVVFSAETQGHKVNPRHLVKTWSVPAPPATVLPNGEFADPKDHRDFVKTWSKLVRDLAAEVKNFEKFVKRRG